MIFPMVSVSLYREKERGRGGRRKREGERERGRERGSFRRGGGGVGGVEKVTSNRSLFTS